MAVWLECFPEKLKFVPEVKRFELSNGLDTELYKNIPTFAGDSVAFSRVDRLGAAVCSARTG